MNQYRYTCIILCKNRFWCPVVFCRVHQHTRAVLQHLLDVLSDRSGHVAGLLPASFLQGQEAHWVKSACTIRDPELLPDIRTSGPWHLLCLGDLFWSPQATWSLSGVDVHQGILWGRVWCLTAKLSFSACAFLIQACSVSFGEKKHPVFQILFCFFVVFILNDSTSPYNW